MQKPKVTFSQKIDRICGGWSRSNSFWDVMQVLACMVSEGLRAEELKKWKANIDPSTYSDFEDLLESLKEEVTQRPFRDILGPVYMEIGSKWSQKAGGEFYTPQEIADLTAYMMFGTPRTEPTTLLEPCCGAGAMILAAGGIYGAGSHLLRVTACDLNRVACEMCYIQTTLNKIPTLVTHMNTITLEEFGCWPNPHWEKASVLAPKVDLEKGTMPAPIRKMIQATLGLEEVA